MGHYAKVVNGAVVNVIVAKQEFIDAFVDSSPGGWLKTSFNTRGGIHYEPDSNFTVPSADQSKALRKNFAGIGMTYDAERDAFIPIQPFPSWVLNDFSCLWEAPVPYPDDGGTYIWDEPTHSWVQVETGG